MFEKKIELILKNKFLIILLIILAIISISHAFNISISYGSTDFSLSPAIIFWDKINPYDYYLYNDNTDKISGWQVPIYAHTTYIIFYIFTLLDLHTANLVWSIFNITLGILIVILISKYQKLKNHEIILLICIFCISTPFRNCVSLGQITFLILLSFSAILLDNSFKRSFLLGISYIKYSFMPILTLIILFQNGFKALLISSLFCLIGWIFFSLYLDQNLFHTLFQPLQVGLNHPNDHLTRGDLFTILGFLTNYEIGFSLNIFRAAVVIILSFFIAKDISKLDDKMLIFCLLSIASLFTFGHLMYDYIFLLPPFIYSFSKRRNTSAKISLLIILYFWFGIRIKDYIMYFMINKTLILSPISYVTNLQVIFNFVLLISLYYLIKKINNSELAK
jgi:hypothetical protein